MSRLRQLVVLTPVVLVAGCTASPPVVPSRLGPPPAIKLVAYDNCATLGRELRKAAHASVTEWGFGGAGRRAIAEQADGMSAVEKSAPSAGFSGTNNHETGADEPDMVKTDGRRIVTVDRGVLRVVDALRRTASGKLDLGFGERPADLLLNGDRALVLLRDGGRVIDDIVIDDIGGPPPITQAKLVLVDLAHEPRIAGTFAIDGTLVDARLSGGVARVVVRSTPRIAFSDQSLDANRRAVDSAPDDAWLPRYDISDGSVQEHGRLRCDQVSVPPVFSGASVVTLLSFDLTDTMLRNGDPVSIAASGDTVYGTPSSIYVADDDRWRSSSTPTTAIYRFDRGTAVSSRFSYTAAGTVPGRLINQYALSEWNGHLRVATTNGNASAVRILRLEGGALTEVGKVDGLGLNEHIQGVRFLADRGYVVTFRQTDPLYALDLHDAANPRLTGELKITGYSAHLQPVGDGRLIGIGQEATTSGRVQGTLVSLFDTGSATPNRLAKREFPGGWSEAENDPHAVLWWPATQLLVIPVMTYDNRTGRSRAVALQVDGDRLVEAGTVSHPVVRDGPSSIRRSLVVGTVLWTLSDVGLQANDLSSLATLAWLPSS